MFGQNIKESGVDVQNYLFQDETQKKRVWKQKTNPRVIRVPTPGSKKVNNSTL